MLGTPDRDAHGARKLWLTRQLTTGPLIALATLTTAGGIGYRPLLLHDKVCTVKCVLAAAPDFPAAPQCGARVAMFRRGSCWLVW